MFALHNKKDGLRLDGQQQGILSLIAERIK